MRKLWYAGAALAGGIFLFGGAVPAQADLLPGTGTAEQQADQRLADLLGQSNGVSVENPLRYSSFKDTSLGHSPVVGFKSGRNSPDLNPMLPGQDDGEQPPGLPPAADLAGGALRAPEIESPVPLPQLPITMDDGLPLIGGLLGGSSNLTQRPTMRQAEAFSGGMPLLGGLGGLLPVNSLPRVLPAGTVPDTTGLPTGGMTVVPADTDSVAPATAPTADPGFAPPAATAPAKAQPADAQPAKAQPAKAQPKPAATPDDPRLHEEPVDGEHVRDRSFSPDSRPVAGVDRQFD